MLWAAQLLHFCRPSVPEVHVPWSPSLHHGPMEPTVLPMRLLLDQAGLHAVVEPLGGQACIASLGGRHHHPTSGQCPPYSILSVCERAPWLLRLGLGRHRCWRDEMLGSIMEQIPLLWCNRGASLCAVAFLPLCDGLFRVGQQVHCWVAWARPDREEDAFQAACWMSGACGPPKCRIANAAPPVDQGCTAQLLIKEVPLVLRVRGGHLQLCTPISRHCVASSDNSATSCVWLCPPKCFFYVTANRHLAAVLRLHRHPWQWLPPTCLELGQFLQGQPIVLVFLLDCQRPICYGGVHSEPCFACYIGEEVRLPAILAQADQRVLLHRDTTRADTG